MQGVVEFIFNNHFSSNLLGNIIVKEFWKSVMIWQNYGNEFRVQFSVHPVGLTTRYCDREPQATHPGFAGEKLRGLLMGRNDKKNATIKDQGMLPPEILDFSLKCGEKQK